MMNFKLLTPPDYAAYRPYFEDQRYPLCAYSLSSIIAWSNTEYKPFAAVNDGALIVAAEFETLHKNRHLLLPISPGRISTPEELVAVADRVRDVLGWEPKHDIHALAKMMVDYDLEHEARPVARQLPLQQLRVGLVRWCGQFAHGEGQDPVALAGEPLGLFE